MKRLTLAIPLCLVALGLAPVPAVADPVTLTSGNVFYHVNDPLFETLPSINGLIVGGSVVSPVSPSWVCSPCAPGDMLNTSVSEDFSTLGAIGSFVFAGTTYNVIDSGSFAINSGTVSVPTIPSGTPFASVFTPFTFAGTLTGVSSGGLTTSLELSGGGTAALMFSQVPGGNPQFFSASYGFESAAAVPEPATLLLVGAAAAGVMVRRRLRAKQDD